jgi:Skp family chaperone for outer membrane proteins
MHREVYWLPSVARSSNGRGLSLVPGASEIDNKVAHLKATVQEALQTLRKDLDELEEDLTRATSADRVIEIARLVRATKKALDGRENDS